MSPAPKGRGPKKLPPGRHGLSPEFVAASQRQRMLTAVIDAVAEMGYMDVKVTDIISRAGISRRTFYEHFDGKEECFLAAYDIEVALLTEAASSAFFADGEAPWPDQLRAGIIALLRHLTTRNAAARACIVEVMGAGATARAKRDAALRAFTYFIDAGRGTTKHEVPGRAAISVIGGIVELMVGELTYGGAGQLEQLAPDAVYLAMLPFMGPEAAFAERERTRQEVATPPPAEQQLAGDQG
jgi:AcrR family transcriptional regulator